MKAINEFLFDIWSDKKKEIHKQTRRKIVKQGYIYWTSIGQNIGCEVYGKGDRFLRPVLVLKCFKIKNEPFFIGVALSSKTKGKSGAAFYKFVDSKGSEQIALLSQLRTFDNKRVKSDFSAKIKNDDFEKLKSKIKALF